MFFREFIVALRALRRSPTFALAVGATLCLCIGANTAIYSALYSLILKPLPFSHPERLFAVLNASDKDERRTFPSSVAQYRDFQASANAFAQTALLLPQNITIESEELPARVENDWVTASFFDLCGVHPVIGRFFRADEEVVGRHHVLVMSHMYWKAHYNGDPGVVGRTVRAGGALYTIIGVAPPSLASLSAQTCFYQPYAPNESRLDPQMRYAAEAMMYVRLQPGVSAAAAAAELSAIETRFKDHEASPSVKAAIEENRYRPVLRRIRMGGSTQEIGSAWLIGASAILLWLLGTVNVTNLFLARVNGKRGEFTTRTALGATRFILMRQVALESLVIVSAAAVVGIAGANLAIRAFNSFLPAIDRNAPPVALDPVVIAAVLIVALGVALLTATIPVQILWRAGARVSATRTSSAGVQIRAVSGMLVVAQVALATILLVPAALLVRSFQNVLAISPGFDTAHVVQGRIALPSRYAASDRLAVQNRIRSAMQDIAGVESVALTAGFSVAASFRTSPIQIRGADTDDGGAQPVAATYAASPSFFSTMGIAVLEGRAFTDNDDFAKNPVVVVDDAFTRTYLAGKPAIGRELVLDPMLSGNLTSCRIVGVVKRANLAGLENRDNVPFVFVPMAGLPAPGFNVLVNTHRPIAETIKLMRAKLRDVDPYLPLYLAESLQETLDAMLLPRRGITLVLMVFSSLAIVLAAIGLYGLLAYDVTQRAKEIGIRVAIGATRPSIVWLVLWHGVTKAIAGLSIGVVVAYGVTHYIGNQLFDVRPTDLFSYASCFLTVAVVALTASAIPAWRAVRIDPLTALRSD